MVSGNAASVESNLGRGRHVHLTLTMKSTEYTAQMGYKFVPPYNPGNYLKTMGTAQEQALVNEIFLKNQAIFSKFTAVGKSIKKHIFTAMEPVFLSPPVDNLTGFGQVSEVTMLQHLFTTYRVID